MKKLKIYSIIFLSFLFLTSYGQNPVSDKTFVTASLGSVLRLRVIRGGNVEFSINSMRQFKNGLDYSASYLTEVSVSSSSSYELFLYAEDNQLLGTDNPSQSIELNNIGYSVQYTGAGHTVGGANELLLESGAVNPSVVVGLTNNTANKAVEKSALDNYGDAATNLFQIQWRCGTKEGTMNTSTLLEQSITQDRYITNILIALQED